MRKYPVFLIALILVMTISGSIFAKTIDNTEVMQEKISEHNPNNVEMEVKTIVAGNSGNTILVDPLYVYSD